MLLLSFLLTPFLAFAQHPEVVRLRGFAEHQSENRRYDKTRDRGEISYLEEVEKWERKRIAAIEEHKRQKKIQSPKEGGPEWQADQKVKRQQELDLAKARQQYVVSRDNFDRSKYKGLPTEAQELDLVGPQRPRYELKKRATFGAPLKFGIRGSGGGSSAGGSFSGSSGGSFPPPPTFDDFGDGDSGYVPAPNLGEYDSGGDFPPPPPPPPPPFTDGGDVPEFAPPPPPVDFGEGMPSDF